MKRRIPFSFVGWAFLLVVVFLVFSCQKSQGGADGASLTSAKASVDPSRPHWQAYQEAGELVWYVNFDWFTTDSGNDIITKEIERLTGTKIIFKKGNDDTLNQMIASGDMPDIVTLDRNIRQFTDSAKRWAIPLNQLADHYDPYFYEVADATSLAWYEDSEGNIYGYPNFSNTPKHVEEGWLMGIEAFMVREDLYDAIGRPDMRQPETFLQALKDVREYDPSITPFALTNLKLGGAAVETLMNFLAIPPVVDGLYNERLYDEEYLRWMEVFRQAYHLGYIADDNFAQDQMQLNENIVQGKYFSFLMNDVGTFDVPISNNYTRNPKERYIAIDGPANNNLDQAELAQKGIGGWTLTYVTKSAKDKERAISLITYLLSKEGQELTAFGIEGETFFIDDDGMYNLSPTVLNMRDNDYDRFLREIRLGELWMLMHDTLRSKYSKDVPIAIIPSRSWTTGKAKPAFLLEDIYPDARSAEDRIWKTYLEERNALAVKMIRSSSNAEMLALVEAFKRDMDKAGWTKVVDTLNANIKRNIERLPN